MKTMSNFGNTKRVFNITGDCKPDRHYMVDLTSRLIQIAAMVQNGDYFSINKARQYGKTTILRALVRFLAKDYDVVSFDFQRFGSNSFRTEEIFVSTLAEEFTRVNFIPKDIKEKLLTMTAKDRYCNLRVLFGILSDWCAIADKPIVLIVDEVDTASNNQVFLDFLSQLRAAYLDRDSTSTFQSVILAGVYDIRNIKLKIRSDDDHRYNSPWNISAEFQVNMNFSASDIVGMLNDYESDHSTGMDVEAVAEMIYSYTSGYPYLVSWICKYADEHCDTKGWIEESILCAVKALTESKNTLFESMTNKLIDYPYLKSIVRMILFDGVDVPYVALNQNIALAEMLGFVCKVNNTVKISNRIFEMVLYNWFLSDEYMGSKLYAVGLRERNRFIVDGQLNMRFILERFVYVFNYLYGDSDETFLEEEGRKYFMLFLKPIINGTGNCYVEAETRNQDRMDLVIDYLGKQFVVELKIWRGDAYNKRGEEQLIRYLDYFGLKKGYMLSFNFNKNKQCGVKDVILGDKMLIEAVV